MDKGHDTGSRDVKTYAGDAHGIYVDEEGNNRTIEDNTVIRSGLGGDLLSLGPTNLVQRNTLYGNGSGPVFVRQERQQTLVEDVFLDNILFATDAQQRTLYSGMNYDNVHFGQSDRNYFYNPYMSRLTST